MFLLRSSKGTLQAVSVKWVIVLAQGLPCRSSTRVFSASSRREMVAQVLISALGSLIVRKLPRASGYCLSLAASLVCIFSKVVHESEECGRLAYKQAHIRQELDYALGNAFGLGRTNN